MAKMNTKDATIVRTQLYGDIENLFEGKYDVEEIKGGRIISDGNFFAKVTVTICDPEKVDTWRAEYQEQQVKNMEKAAAKEAKTVSKAGKSKTGVTIKDQSILTYEDMHIADSIDDI